MLEGFLDSDQGPSVGYLRQTWTSVYIADTTGLPVHTVGIGAAYMQYLDEAGLVAEEPP